ncbi:hypothetical protein WCD74_06705 [Actinomycetospora sp. OC33-EN08]|uniref:Secreted protein n=1 Tax=Actinomycetospora aurantiaca TaxID=3129233 RepID=A0ABU8MKH3_9PSEU
MTALLPASVVVFLAQAPPPAPGADRGEEFGKTSPIALVVILLLGIATALLIRSMTKRLRNVPESFDPPAPEETDGRTPTDTTDPPPAPTVDTPSPRGRSSPEG